MNSKQRIFDNIEQLNYEYNLNLSIPKDVPEGCNVVGWEIESGDEFDFYKECEELYFWSFYIKGWCSVGNISLEQEVSDDIRNDYDYVYLRLTTKDNSDVFTPERLLGVETTKGFITTVIEIGNLDIIKPSYYVYTTESLSKEDLHDVHNLKFFTSDYSDETVSFEEYVRLFYEE